MPQRDDTPRTTTTSVDDGSDDHVTGSDAGTVRDRLDHDGHPRTADRSTDAGMTDRAAREVAGEHDDEPTRSE